MDEQTTPTPDAITIASRVPGFAWAGRLWNTEPEVVRIADVPQNDDGGDGEELGITSAQYAELQRQCAYPLFPLRIGSADGAAQAMADARGELAEMRTAIESERRALDDIKAERKKTDRLLQGARKRLAETETELAKLKDSLAAAEARASAAEAKAADVQVEDKPDPTRPRN